MLRGSSSEKAQGEFLAFVYPNPITSPHKAMLVLESPKNGDFKARVYNVSGEKMAELFIEKKGVYEETKIESQNWPSGVYYGVVRGPLTDHHPIKEKFAFTVVN